MMKPGTPVFHMVDLMDIMRRLFYKVQEIQDRFKGVDFAVPFEDIPVEIGSVYQATTPRIYWYLRRYLRKQKDIKILDVGCGKGRMLAFFQRCNAKKADGLEYSPELVKIAKRNMEVLKLDCEIFQGNAAEWGGYDGYNFFYMFNPFGKDVMKKFIAKIIESYSRDPRVITIIYFNPREGEVLVSAGMRRRELFNSCSIFTLGEIHE